MIFVYLHAVLIQRGRIADVCVYACACVNERRIALL